MVVGVGRSAGVGCLAVGLVRFQAVLASPETCVRVLRIHGLP